MSSCVGTGVAETVVVTSAVETEPTKKFQRSSTLTVITDVKAAGFEIAVPLDEIVAVGGVVGAETEEPEVAFCEAASLEKSISEKSSSIIFESRNTTSYVFLGFGVEGTVVYVSAG